MSAKIYSLDDFLFLLKDVKPGKDGQFMALCPGHDDLNRSLSVKQVNGKILVKCFAGCKLVDILKPLVLEPKDLFLNSPGVRTKLAHRTIEAVYHYDGFEVVRTNPKGFFQRRPDGKGGYITNLKGITPTLYHQDTLKQAIAAGKPIFIAEGEKDVDRLRAEGFTATCNPMGAGKWRDSYSQALQGADLNIIPDNDSPGCDHAAQVARSCYGKAARIRVLELLEGKDVSEWLDMEHTANELTQLASKCPNYKLLANALPEIIVNDRHLRDTTTDALDALYKANKPECIFRRSNALTRISLDEHGRPYTEALTESALRGCLTRAANFLHCSESKKGGDRYTRVSPPLDVVKDCLSLGNWQFPPLLGITEAPVIRPDGTVITEQGYDASTNLYYFPSPKLSMPPIPDKPTDSEVKAAIELVLEPVRDFPFDGEASGANALAAMFTPILRPMIDGPVPLVIIDKPQAGTGASLLAEVVSLIATGRVAAMMTAQKDDEGWRKVITSLLIKGQLVVTIDNVEYDLFTPSLAAILTTTSYQDRVLGRSEMVILPNRTTWIATGNNIRLRGDLPRRCIWVRMDAKIARPWQRDVKRFKHPRLIEWVSTNRGVILAAILTIARAWVVAGMPEAQGLPNLGSYESYCRIVSGVLAHMGVKGFLANLDAMYDETDTETPQWEVFLQTWHDAIGDKALTTTELISYVNKKTDLRAALPDTIADTESWNYIRRLGNALAKKKGVRFTNKLSVTKAGEKQRAACWQVVNSEEADSPCFSFESESSESSSIRQRKGKREDASNNIDKIGGKADSQDSHLALKESESNYAAVLGLPVNDTIKLWQSAGAPIIYLSQGVNCLDLGKLLSRTDVSPEHLEMVRVWLQEHKGGCQC